MDEMQVIYSSFVLFNSTEGLSNVTWTDLIQDHVLRLHKNLGAKHEPA
jgi:hypothetical protein